MVVVVLSKPRIQGTGIEIYTSVEDLLKNLEFEIQHWESLFSEYGERLGKILREIQRDKRKRIQELHLKRKKNGRIRSIDFRRLKGIRLDFSDDWLMTSGTLKVAREEGNEVWARVLLQATEEIQEKLAQLVGRRDGLIAVKNSSVLNNFDLAVYFREGVAEALIPLARQQQENGRRVSVSASFVTSSLSSTRRRADEILVGANKGPN